MRIMEESACKADASETFLPDQRFQGTPPKRRGFDLGNWRVKVHAIQARNCATVVLWMTGINEARLGTTDGASPHREES
jgi:hypothetical protein